MFGAIFGNRYGITVIGAVLIGISVFGMGGSDVMCGSQRMSPGDECVTTSRGGDSTTLSYDEQKSSNERLGWIVLGLGSLMLVGGATSIVVKVVRRPAKPQGVEANATGLNG